MGDSIPIALSPKKQLRKQSGRLPLPVSSPWADPSDPLQYDLRRLPKAEREAARRARVEHPVQTASPKVERVITAEPPAPRFSEVPIRIQARASVSPFAAPSPAVQRRPVPLRASGVHLLLSTVACITALGLFTALSLLLARVPLNTPLSIPLRSDATEAQVHTFLATLLHLPQISSVRFLTEEAQLARASARPFGRSDGQELSSIPEGVSGNPFDDTVEIHVASLRAEALLASFLSQPSLQVLLDERLMSSLAGWEDAVGAKLAQLRVLRQLSSLLLALAIGSMFLTATSFRKL